MFAVGTSEFTEIYQIEFDEEKTNPTKSIPTPLITPDASTSGRSLRPSAGRYSPPRRISSLRHMSARRSARPICTCSPVFFLEESAHQGGVSLSADGAYIAIGANNNVTVYSILSGGTIRKLRRDGRVRTVALSAGGAVVVAGGFDKILTLHKVHDGAVKHTFRSGECTLVRSVHLSADSSRLALGGEGGSAGRKGIVELYDAVTQDRKAFWMHTRAIWSVKLSSNSRLLAAAGYDEMLTLYDT
eukprot:732547-Prymnesium_polylepis.1